MNIYKGLPISVIFGIRSQIDNLVNVVDDITLDINCRSRTIDTELENEMYELRID